MAHQQKNLVWERTVEAAPRLDGRADDHELRPSLRRNASHFLSKAPRPGTDDLPPHADAVGTGHRSRGVEALPERHQLPVEMSVDRKLVLEHGRRDEHDPGAAVSR